MGKGAVYIYNGYTDGLWPKFSQRIAASNIGVGLKGFGISISTANDVNRDSHRGISFRCISRSNCCIVNSKVNQNGVSMN